MDKIIPIVKFDIDETDKKYGIKAISLVSDPAIQSNFEYFNTEKPTSTYVELNGYQQVVHGLALIPDRKIIRYDKETKQPYYGFFTAEVIKKLRNKYHKEMMTSNVNLEHDQKQFIDAYLIESFIIDSPERLADAVKKGMEEATMGSWYVAFKIEDEQAFARVIKGDLNGFSIEASLQSLYKVNKIQNKSENFMNKFLEKFQALLEEMKKSDEKFEAVIAKIKDSVDQVQYGEVGQAVSLILPDGSTKLAPAGTHVLENGNSISVDDLGNLVSVNPTPAPATDVPAPVVASSGMTATVVAEETVVPTGATLPTMVEQAKFSAEKFSAITKEVETLKASNVALNAQIVELSAALVEAKKAPLTTPVVKVDKKVELSREDFSKLSNTEQIAIKNGIDISRTYSALKK